MMALLAEVLHYKPNGREFEFRLLVEIFMEIIVPAAVWLWG
jgi:hypothetical protein